MKMGEFCAAAIDYFCENGLNPQLETTRPTEVVVAEIRKLGNRLFGFLQEQERGILAPLLEELVRSRAMQEETLDFSLQTMVKVYKDETYLEEGRKRSKDRVDKKVNSALQELKKASPGKRGKQD